MSLMATKLARLMYVTSITSITDMAMHAHTAACSDGATARARTHQSTNFCSLPTRTTLARAAALVVVAAACHGLHRRIRTLLREAGQGTPSGPPVASRRLIRARL